MLLLASLCEFNMKLGDDIWFTHIAEKTYVDIYLFVSELFTHITLLTDQLQPLLESVCERNVKLDEH